MLSFFKELFNAGKKLKLAESKILQLESEQQSLQMDIAERDRLVTELRNSLYLLEQKQQKMIDSVLANQMESVMTEAAASMAQLFTQEHLLKNEGKPIQAKDVLAVAMKLVRTFESSGVKIEGTIAETTSFDANRHDLLSVNESVADGEPVVIRMPAVKFGERVIRKMMVSRVVAISEPSQGAV